MNPLGGFSVARRTHLVLRSAHLNTLPAESSDYVWWWLWLLVFIKPHLFHGDVVPFQLRYVHTFSSVAAQQALNQPVAIHAWLGTPTSCAARSSLIWRVASLLVLDEPPLAPNCAALIAKLGPEYVGSFQNVPLPGEALCWICS